MACMRPLAGAAVLAGLWFASPAQAARRASCDRPFATGQETSLSVTSGGASRTALVYVPSSYDGHRRLPVVLSLHGSQSDASEQMIRSEMPSAAEQDRFIAVAPQGALAAPPGFRWNVPGVTTTDPNAPDDEQYLSDLLDRLQATLCVDAQRIYGAGYSGGGRMISQYACDHADRLAAIAPVAGLRAGVPITGPNGPQPDPATCKPTRPVPVITFAGTGDPVNPYTGGGAAYWQYGTAVAQTRWAQLNGCRKGPRVQPVSAHVDRIAYTACRRDADVIQYRVAGGGHTWPGGEAFLPLVPSLGPVTFEIDATGLMWRFFEHFRLRAPAAFHAG